MKNQYRFQKIIIVLLLCISFVIGCSPIQGQSTASDLKIHFIDVGQADCSFIQCGGQTLLIDAGNNDDAQTLVNYLKEQNVSTIDYFVLTHPHEDHMGSADTVIDNFDVDKVFMTSKSENTKTYKDVIASLKNKNITPTEPVVGTTFLVGDASAEILGPTRLDYSNINNTSIVVKLVYQNETALFTGDMEAEAEKELLANQFDLSADLLKVGHHGSATSTSYPFLREVNPKYAVIQCGTGNKYGHPHQETMSKLNDVGAEIFRNDKLGTIIAKSDGNSFTFDKEGISAKQPHTDGNGLGDIDKSSVKDITNHSESAIQSTSVYIGNRNSKKFHLENCTSLPSQKNAVNFESREEAVKNGYEPCKVCNP